MYLGCSCPKPERIEVSQLVSIYWRLYINPIEKEEQQILEVIERAGGVGLIFNDEARPRRIHLGAVGESEHSVYWPVKNELKKVMESKILIEALPNTWRVDRNTGLGGRCADDFMVEASSLSELEEILRTHIESIDRSK